MNSIRPSADLRNQYAELSKQAKEAQKPIYITVNGRGDTVLLNQAVYEKQVAELELLRMLAEADHDIIHNRLVDASTAFDEVENLLKRR